MPADGSAPARKPRKMPAQKPATSEQVVVTPWEFIDAIEERWGKISWDLCASADNCVVRNQDGSRSRCFFSAAEDGLAQDWKNLGGVSYANPEFGQIEEWVKKAAEEADARSRVLILTPASVDANWYWDWVRPYAITYVLRPRLQFVGHTQTFPKGLMLSLFGEGATAFGRWRWRPDKSRGQSARSGGKT